MALLPVHDDDAPSSSSSSSSSTSDSTHRATAPAHRAPAHPANHAHRANATATATATAPATATAALQQWAAYGRATAATASTGNAATTENAAPKGKGKGILGISPRPPTVSDEHTSAPANEHLFLSSMVEEMPWWHGPDPDLEEDISEVSSENDQKSTHGSQLGE